LHGASVQLKPNPHERGTIAQVVFPRHRIPLSPPLTEAPDEFRPYL
jgi:hypothetical protein